jgi:hypothetical protein
MQGTAAACDIAIPLALIWYLRSKKSHGVRTYADRTFSFRQAHCRLQHRANDWRRDPLRYLSWNIDCVSFMEAYSRVSSDIFQNHPNYLPGPSNIHSPFISFRMPTVFQSPTFPDRTYWQPFHQILGKCAVIIRIHIFELTCICHAVYVNSVVASLNVRDIIRGQPDLSGLNTPILQKRWAQRYAILTSRIFLPVYFWCVLDRPKTYL